MPQLLPVLPGTLQHGLKVFVSQQNTTPLVPAMEITFRDEHRTQPNGLAGFDNFILIYSNPGYTFTPTKVREIQDHKGLVNCLVVTVTVTPAKTMSSFQIWISQLLSLFGGSRARGTIGTGTLGGSTNNGINTINLDNLDGVKIYSN